MVEDGVIEFLSASECPSAKNGWLLFVI